MRRRFSGLIILLLAASLGLPASTLAAEGINLQISPLPIELTTNPGTAIATDLRVRNAGNIDQKLAVRLLRVSEDDNGLVHLGQPLASDEWAKWVQFSQTVFDAPSNVWQTIHMTVNVPKSAAFGYYFAVEYLKAVPDQPAAGQAVAQGAVATFILLNAQAPGAKREAEITSFTADHGMYEFLPATFNVKIRATGNVHVAPHGNVFFQSGGKDAGSIEINGPAGNILPNSSRIFSASWSDAFPHYEPVMANGQPVLDQHGQPKRHLVWNWGDITHIRIGHYTAHLVMVYDNGTRDVPIEATVSFWVIPWRLLGAFALIAIFVGLGLFTSFKTVWRRGRKLVKR